MGEGKELRWRDLPSVYERKHIGVYVWVGIIIMVLIVVVLFAQLV